MVLTGCGRQVAVKRYIIVVAEFRRSKYQASLLSASYNNVMHYEGVVNTAVQQKVLM